MQGIKAGTEGDLNPSLDHGTMVPLYFINQHYKSYKIVRISPSGLLLLEHYKLGKLIQSVIPKDKKVVWVASGDLSHKLKKDGPYGWIKEGPLFDKEITEVLKKGDFNRLLTFNPHTVSKAAECGLGSFIMMAGAVDGYQVLPNLLSYEGPFGVGYAVAMFKVLEQDKSRMFDRLYEQNEIDSIESNRHIENPYIKLARESLEYYLKHKKIMPLPKNLTSDFKNKKAGVFVSIHKHNQLRGCVGTTMPTTNCIANEIIQNAVSAGIRDPRFTQVRKKELAYLQYKVDILLPPEPIESIKELDIIKYGVIVRHNYKTGLLLPNLEGIDTVEEQVSIAKRKAGIRDNEIVKLERFEVIRYK